MTLIVGLTLVSVAVSLTGAIEYCSLLHENAKCVSDCPGNDVEAGSHLCSPSSVCCKPAEGTNLTTPAPGTLIVGPDTCGVPGNGRVKRSLSGVPSSKCNWPWLVSIRMGNEDIPVSHVMTGILVSKKTVLVYKEKYEALEPLVTRVEAVVGDYYLNMIGDETNIFPIDTSLHVTVGEFRLLDLGEEVQVGDCVRPICLADETEAGSLNLSQCQLIGWGHTETGTGSLTLAPIPLHENVTFQEKAICDILLTYAPDDEPSGELLCLNSEPNLPQHDEGNPIICPNGNHQWYLKGILAQGNYDVEKGEQATIALAVDVMSSVDDIKMEI